MSREVAGVITEIVFFVGLAMLFIAAEALLPTALAILVQLVLLGVFMLLVAEVVTARWRGTS